MLLLLTSVKFLNDIITVKLTPLKYFNSKSKNLTHLSISQTSKFILNAYSNPAVILLKSFMNHPTKRVV